MLTRLLSVASIASLLLGLFIVGLILDSSFGAWRQRDVQKHLQLAESALKHQDFPSAIHQFSAALRLDPTQKKARLKRGWAYHHQGEQEHALADAATVLREEPSPTEAIDARFLRGNAYLAQGDYRLAVKEFQETLRMAPYHSHAFLKRGSAFAKLHEWDRALIDLNEALKLDPQLTEASVLRAEVLEEKLGKQAP